MKATLIPVVALLTAVSVEAQTRQPPALEVTAVRLWTLSGITRVAIQVSGEFDYHAERAHDPERVFFDIFQSRPNFAGRRLYNQETEDPIVRRIRVAETLPGVTRVVLDLAGKVEYSASQLANPDRLMVEVRLTTDPTLAPPPVSAARPPASVPAARLPVANVEETQRAISAAADKVAKTIPAPPALVTAPPPDAVPGSLPPARVEPPRQEAKLTAPKPELPKAATGATSPTRDLAPPAKPTDTAASAPRRTEFGKAAKPASDGTSSLTRVLGLKINRVVIDPGHGGHDQGTQGPRGLLEKDLVLDVAKRLGKLIEERMSAEVIFTRTDDTFIPLQERTALANDKKADLFLSIHANSSRYPRIAVVESYYLNFTAFQDAMEVAARENASSDKSIFELHDLIQKITLHEKVEESKEFASRIQSSLQAFEARSFPQSKNRGVKRAPFVVLIGAQMPSVLTEVGFLTNPREEALLRKPEYRQRLAEAIYRGISRYAQNLSHFQLAKAKEESK